jgi:hypothetical protein
MEMNSSQEIAAADNLPAPAAGASPPSDPLRWIVPGLLSHGLTILAGPRWSGKSCLALDLGTAVATGGLALHSLGCPRGDVLYLDVENGDRRLEDRLRALLFGRATDLSRLVFSRDAAAPRTFLELLESWRADVAAPRLVVIDAAQQVGPVSRGPWTRRETREQELSEVQQWALRHGVAVLVIARADKEETMKDCSFDVADALLLLDRRAGQSVLTVHSRDLARRKMVLDFESGRLSILDPGDGSRRQNHRADILDVLKTSVWEMSPRQVARELGMTVGNVRRTMSRMARDGEIARSSHGKYLLPKPGLDGLSSFPTVLPEELEHEWFQRHSKDAEATCEVPDGFWMSRTSPD